MVDASGAKLPVAKLPVAEVPVAEVPVVVNGQERRVPDGQPLPDLITELGLRVGAVVVEYNGAALTTGEGRLVRLRAGDRLELVRAVAGG